MKKQPLLQPIRQSDFWYELPDERIARFPLEERDASKLLVYRNGEIRHNRFRYIADELKSGDTLFFNNTKVIPARIFFQKETGALIEVFLLHPVAPTSDVGLMMQQTERCTWACAIGNLKRLKNNTQLERTVEIEGKTVTLRATLQNREVQWVDFQWDNPEISFAELLTYVGVTPLPPYLKRQAEEKDKDAYQTVYAKQEGAVAAPTAGLHFTDYILQEALPKKGIHTNYLTLHVAGGTFQPIKHENTLDHPMHSEQMIVSMENIDCLLAAEDVVAVGTTSMRTLESLYWYGVLLGENPEATFHIPKLMAYDYQPNQLPTRKQAIARVKDYMQRHQLKKIQGETEIMIIPGYDFKVCDALITNFHMPGTTLIMLVAAFIGDDWRKVYQEALANDYRFLSFGDSSLLFRNQPT
ncbi:MAG: S-adenosylmethionine:tRNA ribosyltransferase-isomerase [Cytophagales bacterium]|nr:S-adenosylmethionine:tRNA ribosyltransferase-isomerase [Bernardetiaceae bacterium]MDW8203653.1 S-adenosylmethionine:tRNA ribosyltransferase-isomerase [Cytophagales bacterium]